MRATSQKSVRKQHMHLRVRLYGCPWVNGHRMGCGQHCASLSVRVFVSAPARGVMFIQGTSSNWHMSVRDNPVQLGVRTVVMAERQDSHQIGMHHGSLSMTMWTSCIRVCVNIWRVRGLGRRKAGRGSSGGRTS